MKFKSYILNEGRSQKIDLEETMKLVKSKCKKILKKYIKTSKYIYRGLRENNKNFLFIDPSKGMKRKSLELTYNFYTLLMDNLPSWKNYPKRSRSIICTTNYNATFEYGNPFIVFPYDNAKIGVCSNSDIWFSFKKLNYSLNSLNNDIKKLIEESEVPFSRRKINADWNYFKEIFLKSLEQISLKETIFKLHTNLINDIIYKYKKDNNFNVIGYMDDELSPMINGFKLVKPDIILPDNSELWIGSSPCILISENKINDFMYNIREDIGNEI